MEPKFAQFNVYDGLMVHVELGAKTPNIEEFREFIAGISQLLDNAQPFTFFVDASKLKSVPLSTSLETVAFLRKERVRIKLYMKASAIFIKSEFITNLLNWVFTLQPPVSPNKVVNEPQDGIVFIQQYMNTIIEN